MGGAALLAASLLFAAEAPAQGVAPAIPPPGASASTPPPSPVVPPPISPPVAPAGGTTPAALGGGAAPVLGPADLPQVQALCAAVPDWRQFALCNRLAATPGR
jgi:hypothetical protein